jgi:hypothetical protein
MNAVQTGAGRQMSAELVSVNGQDVPVEKQNYVYLIKSEKTGRFKIGVSKNPTKRLRDLEMQKEEALSLVKQWDCSLFVTRKSHGGTYRSPAPIEKALHRKFCDCRAHGEWFRLSPQNLADLEAIQDVTELARFAGITEINLQSHPTEEQKKAAAMAIAKYWGWA